MDFIKDLGAELKNIAVELRDGAFREKGSIRIITWGGITGSVLMLLGITLMALNASTGMGAAFGVFITGAGILFATFIGMFVQMFQDEREFNKIMARRAARYARR